MVVLMIDVLQILIEELGFREMTSKLTRYATIISSPLQQNVTGCIQCGSNLRKRGTLGVNRIPTEWKMKY
jgi:hypothetical protein